MNIWVPKIRPKNEEDNYAVLVINKQIRIVGLLPKGTSFKYLWVKHVWSKGKGSDYRNSDGC